MAPQVFEYRQNQFQSTLPRGSDRATGSIITRLWTFQSTLPRGSDPESMTGILCSSISIHAPSRERQLLVGALAVLFLFQSTLPRGSDAVPSLHGVTIWRFQSTLPRGSDPNGIVYGAAGVISIHAPSRERPLDRGFLTDRRNISIHAPSRERRSGRYRPRL